MIKPKTLIGYITILQMLDAVCVQELKQGWISTTVKKEVVKIQASLSDQIHKLD